MKSTNRKVSAAEKIHQYYLYAFFGGLLILFISACDSHSPKTTESQPLKTKETENAKEAVADYKANPTATHKAEADKALAQLDKEIAELKERVASKNDPEAAEKLASLENTRADVAQSYSKGEYESVTKKVGDTFKAIGKSISNAAEATVEKVKDTVNPDDKK